MATVATTIANVILRGPTFWCYIFRFFFSISLLPFGLGLIMLTCCWSGVHPPHDLTNSVDVLNGAYWFHVHTLLCMYNCEGAS